MIRTRAGLLGLLILAFAQASLPQTAAPTKPPPASQAPSTGHSRRPADARYSDEPYVIEKYTTAVRFENDGSGERVTTARIRVQAESAVQQLSQLVFGYDSSFEQIDVHFLQVRKPDGSQINAAAGSVKDVPFPTVKDLAAYSNLKEKQISTPPLHAGDILEYEIATRITRARAGGEFWTEHNFLDNAVVLDEALEVNVPQGRMVNIKSVGAPYATDASSAKGRVIYRWKHASLSPPASADQRKSAQAPKGKVPDVEISSFSSWEDVSKWYAKLEHDSTEPNQQIKAKTDEVVRGHDSSLDKIQAIYDYVTRNIRYVDLPFGASGFQPHSAGDVFKNQYGDAADRQALFAAMLQAAGIQVNSALLSSQRSLDSTFPSPSQFDYVVAVVRDANQTIWLDSTAEIAPFRFLPAPVRKKPALIVSPGASGKLAETPSDPPFLSTQNVDIEGQVSSLGKLTARVHYRMRGDNEFVLRIAFHRTPQSQWKELAQTILTFDGVHGEVTSVKPGDPTETHNPFELDIEYAQPNFLDWSAKKTKVPLPLLAIGIPEAPKKSTDPVQLGSPLNVATHLKIELPPGFGAQAPVGIAVARDYADFKSSYRLEGQTLVADRSLNFKMRELPPSRAGDYLNFVHAVEGDQSQPLLVENMATGAPVIPPTATAADLYEAGSAALAAGNINAAIPLFERVIQLEPRYKDTWNNLGLSYLRLGQFDRAASAFQKQIEVDPSDPHAYNYLGVALQQQQKFDEAAMAFRKQIALSPLDTVAHSALGTLYLSQREYAQALPELDKAAVLAPEKAELQVSLGLAYINLGQNEKALAAFDKAVQLSPTPLIWNNVAYNLADHKTELDKALKYAQSALAAASANLRDTDIARLTPEQLNQTMVMGNYWDTLGWVYFRRGDLDSAERYIRSAWLLEQHGEMADHLAQIDEKRGQKEAAVRMYALALAAPHSSPDSRARLTLLLGGNSAIDDLVSKAAPALISSRTFAAGKLGENARAEFLLLLSPGDRQSSAAHAGAVRFLGGSEKLRPFTEKLKSLDYGAMFPTASPVKLIRRGTLSCSAATGECSLLLLLPEEIHAN